ncbi:SART-1 family protein [Acrasis kona]|uniref:SART-1 family protein n=1 Tax=Acrasis kona TaxID=1008807 RepID=A0AAW2YXR8_9EUKA
MGDRNDRYGHSKSDGSTRSQSIDEDKSMRESLPSFKTETSADGTISMSIEDTNKLRISLGLKPLKVAEEDLKKQNEIFVSSKDDGKKDEQDALKRIQQARMRRKEREILRTKGLADDSDEEKDEKKQLLSFVKNQKEAQDRIKKSQQDAKEILQLELESEEAIQDTIRRRKKDLPKYDSNDIKDIKIAHDTSTVNNSMGDTGIILTLQDKDVMDESEDQLENTTLLDAEKREWNKKNAKKKGPGMGVNRGTYDATISLEEDQDLLSQYDDDKQELQRKSFVVDQANNSSSVSQPPTTFKNEEEDGRISYNVNDYAQRIAQDYVQKPVKVKKRTQKNVQMKQRSAESIINTTEADQSQHRGRRRVQEDVPEQDHLNKMDHGYEIALRKAKERAEALLKRDTTRPEDVVLEGVQEAIRQESEVQPNENVIKFDPVSEFARNVKKENDEDDMYRVNVPTVKKRVTASNPSNIKKRSTFDDENDVDMNEPAPVQQPLPSTSESEPTPDEPTEETSNEVDKEDLLQEPTIGTGLAAALRFAESKGLLAANDNDYGGRNNDKPLSIMERTKKRPHNVFQSFDDTNADEDEDMFIGRVNKFGERMTPKDQFRELSRHFHNAFPSKNKQEKELKRYEQKMRKKNASETDTPLNAVKHHEKIVEKLQQPYFIVEDTNLSVVAKAAKEVAKENPELHKKKKLKINK